MTLCVIWRDESERGLKSNGTKTYVSVYVKVHFNESQNSV
jgi:hypothetical protein